MRAAAVALVLIVGAAVVLWYGNTLNSWVLGGLIGGLAALLLSIPISLILFSYISRRHEEQYRPEAQEEEESYHYQETAVEVYETDADLISAEEEWREEANYYQAPRQRNLPVASPYPRLPVARQNYQPTLENVALRQRSTAYPLTNERQRVDIPGINGTGTPYPPRRSAPARQIRYPGFPGYKVTSQRGQQQTAALRAARQEAARQQQYSDTEYFPHTTSRRLPIPRTEQNLVRPPAQPGMPRASRPLPQQPQAPGQYKPKRTVEGSSVPPVNGRALPESGETSINRRTTQGMNPRMQEPHTDRIGGPYPQTGQIRQQPLAPQTGQMTRNPQLEAQRRNPDVISGSLKNPLVRRAPYMYEDDPLRQQLAQHLEAPPVRRSSRHAADEEE